MTCRHLKNSKALQVFLFYLPLSTQKLILFICLSSLRSIACMEVLEQKMIVLVRVIQYNGVVCGISVQYDSCCWSFCVENESALNMIRVVGPFALKTKSFLLFITAHWNKTFLLYFFYCIIIIWLLLVSYFNVFKKNTVPIIRMLYTLPFKRTKLWRIMYNHDTYYRSTCHNFP